MFDEQQKSSGTTTTVAFLAVAFVFIPALLMISRPVGTIAVVSGVICGVICLALAALNYRKSARVAVLAATVGKAK